jgi:O-antigen/teichoic acid export membrane protein
MAEGLKKTISHAGVYGLGTALQNIVSVVMLPVYTRYLSPAEYGILELMQMILDLAGIIFGARLAVGLYRYYFGEESEDERRSIISTALLGNVGVNTLGSVFVAVFAVPLGMAFFGNNDHLELIVMFAFSLATGALLNVPMLYIRALQRPWLFISMSLTKLLCQVALNILLVVVMRKGVEGVILSTLITGAIIGGGLTIWTLAQTGVRFSLPFMRKLWAFSFPVVLAALGAYYTTFGDRFVLQRFHGLAEVGVYALAYRFGFVLAKAIGGSLYSVWSTQQFEVYRQSGATEMFQRAFLLFSLALLTGACAMALFAEEALKLLAGKPFWPAYQYVPLIVLAYVLKSITVVCSFGIQLSEKTRDFAWASLASVLVMTIGFVTLIPMFGGMGAALATLLGAIAELLWTNIRSQRYYDMKLPWGKFMGAVGLAATVWAISLLAPHNIIESLLFKLFLFVGFAVALFYSPIVGEKERRAAFRLLKDVRQKGSKAFGT